MVGMKKVLTADQETAKNLIKEWYFNSDDQFFVLSGYAGTGKTFLIDYVVRNEIKLKIGEEVVFISPTGKAASILVKRGTPASTLHSLIYVRDEDDFDVDENGEIIPSQRLSFFKREKIDEKIKLIVIDEASMVGADVLRDLLSFGVKCLFSGDGAQLPPVNGICPLMQLIDYTLTEIVRQAEDNPIVKLATMARSGQQIPYGNYDDKVYVLPRGALRGEKRKEIFLEADQIICGLNRTRNSLNAEIRRYRGVPADALLPIEGEKLICTLNDWEKPLDEKEDFFLVNGIIGYAENVCEGYDKIATMDFRADFLDTSVRSAFDTGIFIDGRYAHDYGDRAVTLADGSVVHEDDYARLFRKKSVSDEVIDRFEFAYAITCHKAQGSEFDFVVVFDESWAFQDERDKWLYTAITRAKEKLIIVR